MMANQGVVRAAMSALVLAATLLCVSGCGQGRVSETTASASTTTNGATDLRDRPDNELENLMPSDQDFPFQVKQSKAPLSNAKLTLPAPCGLEPWRHLSLAQPVSEKYGSSSNANSFMAVNIYRQPQDVNLVSEISSYVTRCPEYSYSNDSNNVVRIQFKPISVPKVPAQETFGYRAYGNDVGLDTNLVAASRGLLIEVRWDKDADAKVGTRLFETAVANVSKA